jgi:tetratricopeptide (TPR) repeat protein
MELAISKETTKMKYVCGLAAFALFSMASLSGQGTNPPAQAESNAGQLVAEGVRLFTAGNISAALEKFRQAHSLAPDDVSPIIGLARAESKHVDNSGKLDMQEQALADYRTALAKQPTAELYTELGISFDDKQDYAAAIKAYRKALDLNPQFFDAELNYGRDLANVGDFDNAISVYSKACAHSGPTQPGAATGCGSVEIAADRGWAYFEKGDCPSLSLAEKDFAEAVSLEPGDADLHGRLGAVLLGEGMENLSNCAHSKQERNAYLEHAWSELRIAVNLDSSNAVSRGEFVTVSEILKRKPEYNGGIAKDPDKNELSQLLPDHAPDSAESLGSLEDKQLAAEHNKSLAAAKEAVRRKPTDGYAWLSLGNAYMDLDDYKSAEEPLKRALQAFLSAKPDLSLPFNAQPSQSMAGSTAGLLSVVCDKLHRKREANRYRDLAISLLPTH